MYCERDTRSSNAHGPSSGTPTAAECSESEPQRDGSPTCGCMKEMSGCSIHPNTRDEWILSQRDSLASLLASPEIARGRVTKENCSERSFAAWMSSDPNMSFSKMCLDFSRHDPALAYAAGCSCHIEEHGQLPIGNKRQLVCPGDFIVPSTCGDLYPVDPETFWQLYELVE